MMCEEVLDLVDEWLTYLPKEGEFVWRKKPNRRIRIGSYAGSLREDGYVNVRLEGTSYMVHRLVFLKEHRRWPTEILDHIDTDRRNNRIDNLRECDHGQNLCNRGAQVNNTSGYKGVARCSRNTGWVSRIHVHGKTTYLGTFNTRKEASRAYMEAAKQYHGDFAYQGES